MQSDSDTESEHECSIEPRLGCKDGVINGLTSSRSESSTFNGGKNASRHEQLVRNQDSLLAVEQIKSVDLSTVHQVRLHHCQRNVYLLFYRISTPEMAYTKHTLPLFVS